MDAAFLAEWLRLMKRHPESIDPRFMLAVSDGLEAAQNLDNRARFQSEAAWARGVLAEAEA